MLLRASLYIIIFLTSIVVCLKIAEPKLRRTVLLVGSYVLYCTWGKWFAAVLLASTAINFVFGKWVRQKSSGLALPLAILFNLVLLSSFKYVPQMAANVP